MNNATKAFVAAALASTFVGGSALVIGVREAHAQADVTVGNLRGVLKLCAAGIFTQGDLMMKARRLLMASLAKPGFLTTYIAQLEQERSAGVDKDQVVAELATQLEGIGIAPEDALRALAA